MPNTRSVGRTNSPREFVFVSINDVRVRCKRTELRYRQLRYRQLRGVTTNLFTSSRSASEHVACAFMLGPCIAINPACLYTSFTGAGSMLALAPLASGYARSSRPTPGVLRASRLIRINRAPSWFTRKHPLIETCELIIQLFEVNIAFLDVSPNVHVYPVKVVDGP
jgi:hypothetical protein